MKNKIENEAPESDSETIENTAPKKTNVDKLIEHYKEEGIRRETIATAWLYKFDDDKSGSDMTGIGHFSGELIPDPHQIGIKFGAGRYGIKLYNAKGKAKEEIQNWCTFRLHPVYNEYKAAADAEKRREELSKISGGLPATVPAGPAAGESFLMVKEILSLILPVMQQANRAAAIPAAPRQETPAEMFNSYQMMQKLLKNNLFDTAETLKQYSRRYAGPAADMEIEENDSEPEEKEKSVMEKIIDMIEPFFGLIASKSPAASIAAQGLRAAPQFIEILNDPALCRMIVQHFDRTKGRAASDIALQNIGINRAALFQIAAGTPANSTTRQTPARAATGPGNSNNGKRTALKPQQTAATIAKTQ